MKRSEGSEYIEWGLLFVSAELISSIQGIDYKNQRGINKRTIEVEV